MSHKHYSLIMILFQVVSLAWLSRLVKCRYISEKLLIEDLMKDYSSNIPPPLYLDETTNQIYPVNISVQIEIYGIVEVDVLTTTATLKACVRQYWHDQRLIWEPKLYDGIKSIWLKTDPDEEYKIWTSDIYIR